MAQTLKQVDVFVTSLGIQYYIQYLITVNISYQIVLETRKKAFKSLYGVIMVSSEACFRPCGANVRLWEYLEEMLLHMFTSFSLDFRPHTHADICLLKFVEQDLSPNLAPLIHKNVKVLQIIN